MIGAVTKSLRVAKGSQIAAWCSPGLIPVK
jgi:hypothetical protein